MRDFRYGTLVLIPPAELRKTVDQLRAKYDPISAATSMAHITITQPFAKEPTADDIAVVKSTIKRRQSLDITIGPVTTSPNKRLLWLDVDHKEEIISLRDGLHETGLFLTDLPLTKGFIPHMTISEAGRDPVEVHSIMEVLNNQMKSQGSKISCVTWIVPNEYFCFKENQEFKLG